MQISAVVGSCLTIGVYSDMFNAFILLCVAVFMSGIGNPHAFHCSIVSVA